MFAMIAGVPIIFALWLAIFLKWQRGVWMLLLYLPFAGILTLALRPSPIGTLLKDFLFVIPTYTIFFLLHTQELRHARVPQALTLLVVVFSSLVVLQLFNPNIKNFIIGLIGVKDHRSHWREGMADLFAADLHERRIFPHLRGSRPGAAGHRRDRSHPVYGRYS